MTFFKQSDSVSSKKNSSVAEDELNSDRLARQAMLAGVLVTLISLFVLPRLLQSVFGETGEVGDTIGGIAGPILNVTGLIIVYYSLREQILANKQQSAQLQHEIERNRNEREFDLTFRLLEKLIDQARQSADAFQKVGEADWVANYFGRMGATNEEVKSDKTAYTTYARAISNLSESYTMIAKRIASPGLMLDQQAVLQRVLMMQYEPYLRESEESYTRAFNNGDEVPIILKAIQEQLHVLLTQRNRIEAELKKQDMDNTATGG